eukprot:3561622-Pleurochrysis_carterae.AAC.1
MSRLGKWERLHDMKVPKLTLCYTAMCGTDGLVLCLFHNVQQQETNKPPFLRVATMTHAVSLS